MSKPRILFLGEGSLLNTGFSNIGRELLTRFHNLGYPVAELGSYVATNNPDNFKFPWDIYGVMPENEAEARVFNGSPVNQFGRYKFEKVCLEFKPTHVFCQRDWWMDEFVGKSPFRRFFKWIWVPPLDGQPQRPEHLETFKNVDTLIPMTQFAKELITTELNNNVPNLYPEVFRSSVDPDVFKPLDKAKIRQELGFKPDDNVILFLARNQPRKLFPDIIEAFADLLEYARDKGNDKIYNNTYLVLSTSFPDMGFDFPRNIFWTAAGSRIRLNYFCEKCHRFQPLAWQGPQRVCTFGCGGKMSLPNSSKGLTTQQLVQTYNIADLYVQYCTSEGLCVPIAEARSCEVPAAGNNVTTLREQVDILLENDRYFWENVREVGQARFLASNKSFVKNVYDFFYKSKAQQRQMGEAARKDVLERWSINRSFDILKNIIDNSHPTESWDDKPKLMTLKQPPEDVPTNVLVAWVCSNVLNNPKLIGTQWYFDKIAGIDEGYIKKQPKGIEPYTLDRFLGETKQTVELNNFWESKRTANANSKKMDLVIV
jgi:glycosyltransferase involved in cell wall biosynthesis